MYTAPIKDGKLIHTSRYIISKCLISADKNFIFILNDLQFCRSKPHLQILNAHSVQTL
jgi:hypothetical protein